MKKRNILAIMMVLLALVMAGCGSETATETTAATVAATVPAADPSQPLSLTGWSMDATAWSSPNGATVNLTATPSGYAEGQSAVFSVRLDGEEVTSVPCDWDGSVYTASAELNAEDGYCYFVLLTTSAGVESEVAVNTPAAPSDESLIDLADALNSYASITVNASELKDGKLTITDGSVQIQLPKLTLREGNVSCSEAVLVLNHNDQEASRQTLSVADADESGLCSISLNGISFSVPGDMEDDHRLSLRLEAALSDGQTLTASGSAWHYFDGGLVHAVG